MKNYPSCMPCSIHNKVCCFLFLSLPFIKISSHFFFSFFKQLSINFLLAGMLIFSAGNAAAQPSADFSASTLGGCSPLLVKFSDLSKGKPDKWKWDLGNGNISYLQNPSATYSSPGQYRVVLTVSNKAGSSSIVKEQYITVYNAPAVHFTVAISSTCIPVPVQFTDSSSAGSGQISTWKWDFGDGSIGTLPAMQHVYTLPGRRNVTLEVKNSFGCSASKKLFAVIDIPQPVAASFNNSTQSTCKPPLAISFTNKSTGPAGLNFNWLFGDGDSAAVIHPAHTFIKEGIYNIRLIATSPAGCRDTAQKIMVAGTVNTDFTSTTACPGKALVFTNTSMPAPDAIRWNFGDTTVSEEMNPVKTFNQPGKYKVFLTADYGSCKDSVRKMVEVFERPSFSAPDTVRCQPPFTVNFKSNLPPALNQYWDFGNGSTSTLQNPSHTYTAKGVFNVMLVSGCNDTIIKQSYIKIESPSIKFSGYPVEKCLPYTHRFSAAVNAGEQITAYRWDFGDGDTSAAIMPAHTYTIAGSYTIRLTVTTVSGCSITSVINNGMLVGNKPAALFSATPVDNCSTVPVNFTDLSGGNANRWIWDFGDTDTSQMQHPNHTYKDTGYFNIMLIAKNYGCADTLKFSKYIYIKPAIANFFAVHNCSVPRQKSFENISIGADSCQWNFGDGSSSNEGSPVHTYAADGTYKVILTVTNSRTGCENKKAINVLVYSQPKGKPAFTASDTSLCRGEQVNFTIQNMDADKMTRYKWEYGDGTVVQYPGYTKNFTYAYKKSGLYNIRLITTNIAGCMDTVQKTAYISVGAPLAAFTTDRTGTCLNSSIQFTDTSSSLLPVIERQWSFGDGVIESVTLSSVSHLYRNTGTYAIKLKITDSNGCTDSIHKPGYISISRPVAAFKTPDTASCPFSMVAFNNTSSGYRLRYLWNFGDGKTSVEINPVHQYTSVGKYTVSLSIIDQYGCSDSIIKKDYIAITHPAAAFSMSDSVSACPPFFVQFTNAASDYTRLKWDFGDGHTSSLQHPTHSFTTPGNYTVQLTATGAGGCTAMAVDHVTVKGPTGKLSCVQPFGCDSLHASFTAHITDNNSFMWDFGDGNIAPGDDSVIRHLYNNRGLYIPKIILEDAAGCKVAVSASDSIHVEGIDAAFNFQQKFVCDTGTISFTDGSYATEAIISYEWNFADNTYSDKKNPQHQFSKGNYYPSLTVSSLHGCSDTYTSPMPVQIFPTPEVDIAGVLQGCVPLQANVQAAILNDTAPVQWKWNFSDGDISPLQHPAAKLYKTAGVYPLQLTATGANGCKKIITKNIEAFALPAVNAGADTFVCSGSGIVLQAKGALLYTWNSHPGLSCTDCANPLVSPAATTVFSVKGISNKGCTAADSVQVQVKRPFKISYSAAINVCKGTAEKLEAAGAAVYEWSPAAGLSDKYSAHPAATPDSTTTYRVIGTDDGSCFKDTGFVKLTVYPIPLVDAGPDQTINVGNTLDLLPVISGDVTEVLWSPTGGQFRNIYPGITVKPLQTTEYTVEVSNRGKCRARDNVKVLVLCDGTNVFIPNTFSPNADGNNDIFFTRGNGLFKIKNLKIFNRWGQQVFEKNSFNANDPSAGWDGSFKGQLLPSDVYVYTVQLICDNKSVLTFNGNIFMAR